MSNIKSIKSIEQINCQMHCNIKSNALPNILKNLLTLAEDFSPSIGDFLYNFIGF